LPEMETEELYRCILQYTEITVAGRSYKSVWSSAVRNEEMPVREFDLSSFNPLAYTDVPETAGLARSINP